MRIEHLRIELRPRTNAQALDLGFALVRANPYPVYMAFLALWTPLIVAAMLLTYWFPALQFLWIFLPWWVLPLLERAPLYVLSRQVFGSEVSWQEAVRAWPRQLGGGWFRLLTWGRPISPGRSLYHPVWQLENARGKVAAARRAVLSRKGTGPAAAWFGVVCAHLTGVLQIGIIGFISILHPEGDFSNPFKILVGAGNSPLIQVLSVGVYGLSAGLIAPFYTACGFTLYLNRRASLEAWDIEIKLRQIAAPSRAHQRPQAGGVALGAGALVLALTLALPGQAEAAPNTRAQCEARMPNAVERAPSHGPRQDARRKLVDQIYASDDLRGFECSQTWRPKKKADKEKEKSSPYDFKLDALADLIKVLLIALALGLAGYLLYRYRGRFPQLRRRARAVLATEVGGLDIRAESLPDNVSQAVRQLWAAGQRRAALALLYRATLSRLVTQDQLALRQGDTEGDCLRKARSSRALARGRLDVLVAATSMWLGGAYGNRWPADAALAAACAGWEQQFGDRAQAAP